MLVFWQGEAVLEVFKILGLNESEVNVLFSIFSEIDSHKTGEWEGINPSCSPSPPSSTGCCVSSHSPLPPQLE